MSEERERQLVQLQERLGHRFGDIGLLERALVHRTYANDRGLRDVHGLHEDNERLEFLGDVVWRLVVSEFLFERYPGASEGVLTKRRKNLVRGGHQVILGRSLGLDGPGLLLAGRMPAAEAQRGEATRLENVFEAVVGAVFLDVGYDTTLALLRALVERADAAYSAAAEPKSLLQEALQARGLPLPAYATVDQGGPDHAKWFECAALVVTRDGAEPAEWGRGRAGSQKKAQLSAAAEAYRALVEAGLIQPDGGQ